MTMLVVVLMGGPGAGKGTQSSLLEEKLGLKHIATGNLFRESVREESELGELARSYLDAGELVPDDVTVAMVIERLSRDDCSRGVFLDGFPRTPNQAEALDVMLNDLDAKVSLVAYIDVNEEKLLERLAGRWTCKKCGHTYHVRFSPPEIAGICDLDGGKLHQRSDDKVATQKRRIGIYERQTRPVLNWYRERGLVVRIDGDQPIMDVHKALVDAIEMNARELGSVPTEIE